MGNIRTVVIFIAWLAMLAAAACGTQSARQSPENSGERAQAEAPLTGSAEDFERAQFDDPTDIDNKWLPLKPGTQFVYEGSTFIVEEQLREVHRVVFTVTDLTKVIDGVRTLLVWDRSDER